MAGRCAQRRQEAGQAMRGQPPAGAAPAVRPAPADRPVAAQGGSRRPAARRTALQLIGLIAVLVAAGAVLGPRLPRPAEVWRSLLGAHPGWLLAAVLAEGVSLGMFAHQQRRLLKAFGVPMSMRRARAITYSRSAIAISLPAGSALSAGYAFRQFRAGGANRATAATVIVLSGLISTLALGLLYLSGLLALATGPVVGVGERHPLLLTASAVLVVGTVTAVTYLRSAYQARHPHPDRPWAHGRLVTGLTRRWPGAAGRLRPVVQAADSARRVPARHWNLALAYAAVNWLADLGCLIASARAFDLTLSVTTLAVIYVGVQLVRQIPITPGGVGLIEASLLAGLVSTGAPQAAAAAAVLVYRLLSCWLIIPVGLFAWNRLRRLPFAGGAQPDAPATS